MMGHLVAACGAGTIVALMAVREGGCQPLSTDEPDTACPLVTYSVFR